MVCELSPSPLPGPDRTAAARAHQVRFLTYNVRRCYGLDGRYAPERIAEVIAESGADVVALQELDMHRLRSGNVDQAGVIAAMLRMNYHFHPALRVVEESYGDAILTALPMRLVKAGALPALRTHRMLEPRGALWVEIQIAHTAVQVFNTHFGLIPQECVIQAEALLGPGWLGSLAPKAPAVLLGDFNSHALTRAYKRLAARLRDAHAVASPRPSPTFPSRWPLLRIDHVFAHGDIEVVSARPLRTQIARVASDHLPLSVDLKLPNAQIADIPDRGGALAFLSEDER